MIVVSKQQRCNQMLDNERMCYGSDETDAYHVKMLVSLATLTRIGNASPLSILTSLSLQRSLSFPSPNTFTRIWNSSDCSSLRLCVGYIPKGCNETMHPVYLRSCQGFLFPICHSVIHARFLLCSMQCIFKKSR